MTRNRQKIQTLTLAAFFVALQVIMGFTPIGYIPVGALSITTMHLPVLLAGILLGRRFGIGIGFVFGLISFLRATFQPGITSFVFSPFITVGGISGNAYSLIICFIPRMLMGYLAGVLFDVLKKHMHNDVLACSISAVVNTILHTIGVLGGIYIFFAQEYAQALGTSVTAVAGLLLGVVGSNMILEAILAGIAIPALYKALLPAVKHKG